MPSRRCSPSLMLASNPSSTMSTRRSVVTISSSKLGFFETNALITGANMKAAMELGALIRTAEGRVAELVQSVERRADVTEGGRQLREQLRSRIGQRDAARGAVEQANAES